jgi:hypothetical protein
MRTILLGICIATTLFATAQRKCASSNYLEQQKQLDPTFSNRINELENFIRHQSRIAVMNKTDGQTASIIHIPVVVHVLYKSSNQNISDQQIKSQIDALNRDFRHQNADTVNTPVRFKPLAADVQVEFALATADPQGRATAGIIRKQVNVSNWDMDDKIKFSSSNGDDAWDSRYYLNIWVGNLFGLLGYSSLPGGPAEKDGVVINVSAFGTINTAAPYHLGRTAVHEIGHWLGLRHIWGDTYCGDDLVDDTPKQGNFTPGCPNGFRTSCDNGTSGDMYMNYMDFTDDACLNMFTQGQKARMLSLFNPGGPRNTLLSSKGLSQPWNHEAPPPVVVDTPVTTQFKMYPNPVSSEVMVDFNNDQNWIGKPISIVNMNGTVIFSTMVSSKLQKLNISQLRPGIYFIQGDNGNKKIREKLIKL